VQRPAPGTDLVFSIDTLVEGVHFPEHYPPEYLGWRALAVAVSDLAAMGADPLCYTLALTLPAAEERWLEAFASGLASASDAFGIALAGGDTTRGPLTLTLQVHGSVPTGTAITRSGARAGDLVCVSGTLGDAGAALDWLASEDPGPQARVVLESYHHPRPQLALGQALRGQSSAAIDISDGLLADLKHVLEASGVGVQLEAGKLPLSEALLALKNREKAVELALTAGDDYQLCVTMDPERFHALPEGVRCQLTVVGTVEAGNTIRLIGAPAGLGAGYDHFREYS
jgi:thiamine-monophosphate kinase